jgi:UDP-N-acetylmuramyl pentapeptide phosphotransferase/UDP-N-acetylglucosamine-1-phosphate transferase
MKNNSKNRTAKKRISPASHGIDAPLMKGDLLVLPLGILVAIYISFITTSSANIFQNPQAVSWDFLLSILMIIIFGFLYFYHTFRRRPRSLFTRIIASAITTILLLAILLVLIFTSGAETCTGIMGGRTDCVGLQYGALYLLLFNPYTTPALGILSLIGIISVLLKVKKDVR